MSKDLYQQLSDERKQHQSEGLMPQWYTTAGWQMFKEKYLYGTDSVKGQFERIARAAAKHLAGIEMEEVAYEKFFNMLWNGWLSCSTPVLANMGTNRGMPVSCSGGTVQDSVDDFYKSRHETAMLTKYGFGTSAYLGNIRPRGSKISKGGKASGSIPVFKGFVQDMRDIAQGSSRRGAWAGYLPIEHKDFDELADLVLSEPDDANVGWNISNEFIEKLNNGDSEALRRYQKAMKLKMVTGKGYFFFIDKTNAKRPESYVKNDLHVKASNLCVAPETLVLTDEGYKKISSLENQDVNVWNGLEFSKVTIKKTGENQRLIKVVTHAGFELDCTPYHKFYIEGNPIPVQADQLNSGDELIVFYRPNGERIALTVTGVFDKGRIDDTYCFTEPKRGMGVFNGILTGQCSEITLFSDENHTFTCVLSSLNVAKYDEWKDTDTIFWATVFLDCIAEEFIQKGESISGLEKAVRFTKKGRALGLGQCGLHTYLQTNMIPFESLKAHLVSTSIAKQIDEESLKASQWMAEKMGEPEWCKGIGLRNTHRIAIAPTKSTAVLMGGVSEGINPDPAMSYTQMTAAGEVERVNPTLLKLMKERGVYTKRHITDIKDKMGSVQHVTWLSDEEKAVFKTAFEIDQSVIVRMASARANFIDQWQSLNLFFAADEDPSWISKVHKQAFNDPNILGLYYIYTQAGVQASKEECQACQ